MTTRPSTDPAQPVLPVDATSVPAPARSRTRRQEDQVLRFDAAERLAHWLTALTVLTLVATGIILYVPSLSLLVGRRLLIENLHVYAGVAVFVPLLAAAAGPWGRRLRHDLVSMNRFSAAEQEWLRSLGRRGRAGVGKFNPGQKLNAFAVASLLAVLLVTGLMLRWGNFLAVSWRTGATFVHDWFALAAVVIVTGHIVMALAHPPALRSMVSGRVPRTWLERHAPAWHGDDRPGGRAGGGAAEDPACDAGARESSRNSPQTLIDHSDFSQRLGGN